MIPLASILPVIANTIVSAVRVITTRGADPQVFSAECIRRSHQRGSAGLIRVFNHRGEGDVVISRVELWPGTAMRLRVLSDVSSFRPNSDERVVRPQSELFVHVPLSQIGPACTAQRVRVVTDRRFRQDALHPERLRNSAHDESNDVTYRMDYDLGRYFAVHNRDMARSWPFDEADPESVSALARIDAKQRKCEERRRRREAR